MFSTPPTVFTTHAFLLTLRLSFSHVCYSGGVGSPKTPTRVTIDLRGTYEFFQESQLAYGQLDFRRDSKVPGLPVVT